MVHREMFFQLRLEMTKIWTWLVLSLGEDDIMAQDESETKGRGYQATTPKEIRLLNNETQGDLYDTVPPLEGVRTN
jgi:hypothetical protein